MCACRDPSRSSDADYVFDEDYVQCCLVLIFCQIVQFVVNAMDALSSLLQLIRPRGHIFFSGEYCGDFAVDLSGDGRAKFHVIAGGQCWLNAEGFEEQGALRAGDFVMFPHDASLALLPHPPGHSGTEGEEGFVSLICGYYEFFSRRVNPVLAALPDVVVVREKDRLKHSHIGQLLSIMRHEAASEAAGANMAIDLLSEVLFMFVLRTLADDPARSPTFLRAFADPVTARALGVMHEHPHKPWTVASLAETAAVSRTAFSKRFHELVGITPLAYLTRYRMDLAAEWLRQGELSMEEIAERCGYNSVAAFAKAFKKETGSTPGMIRRENRSDPVSTSTRT
jgi:AraC-like DNA-binding protein